MDGEWVGWLVFIWRQWVTFVMAFGVEITLAGELDGQKYGAGQRGPSVRLASSGGFFARWLARVVSKWHEPDLLAALSVIDYVSV